MKKEQFTMGCKFGLMSVATLSALSFLAPANAQAERVSALTVDAVQQGKVKVTGTILDSKGEPIVNATIREVGTKNATITDFDGNYTMNVVPGATLQVSSVGFKSKTLKVGKTGKVNFTLEEDATMLV